MNPVTKAAMDRPIAHFSRVIASGWPFFAFDMIAKMSAGRPHRQQQMHPKTLSTIFHKEHKILGLNIF